jgi:Zn finger protein HypA/HybF involved in hydrogenase expression
MTYKVRCLDCGYETTLSESEYQEWVRTRYVKETDGFICPRCRGKRVFLTGGFYIETPDGTFKLEWK